MKFLKNRKFDLLLIFSLLIFCSVFIFSPFSFEKLVKAFDGDYARDISGNEIIDLDDWNYLDDDFLFRDGSNNMDGDLNMDEHRIVNLETPASTDLNHGATVEYVEDAISAAAAGGGDTFVNWGDNICPAGTNLLYSGLAFSAKYNSISGGSNPVCIQDDDPGEAYGSSYGDKMYPLTTGTSDSLPSDGTYSGTTIIQCAMCHKPASTCFEYFGRDDCGSSGFSITYNGYVLGSHAENDLVNPSAHHNPTQRACVNKIFDSSISAGANLGAIWYGSKIDDDFELGFVEDSFIKCAICCN